MKVYISLPITGHDYDEVEARALFAESIIEKSKHIPVNPVNLAPSPDVAYSEIMGICIKELLECDAIVFLDGWEQSKGCKLEYQTARIYGIKIFNSLDELSLLDSI